MVAPSYSEVKQSRKVKPLPCAGQGDIGRIYMKSKGRNVDK